jgi:hypothetical protein
VVVARNKVVLQKIGAMFGRNRPRDVVKRHRSMRLAQKVAKKHEAGSSEET